MSTGSQWIASRTFGLGCTYLRCIPRMRLAHSTRPWARRARKSSAGIRRGGQTTLVTAVCSWRMTPTSAPCRSLEQRSPSGHHARMESATAAILASPRESGRVAAVGSFDAPWAHRSHRYRSQAPLKCTCIWVHPAGIRKARPPPLHRTETCRNSVAPKAHGGSPRFGSQSWHQDDKARCLVA